MGKYMARRFIQSVLLFLVFITVTWFLLYALPGDIVTTKFRTNPNIPPAAAETAIRRLGLDRPILEQFWTYVTGFFRGDFGESFNQYPRPVTDIIGERLPRTIVLFLTAIGVQAGSELVEGVREAGLRLFVAGAFITILPLLAGVLYGKLVLRLTRRSCSARCAGGSRARRPSA